MKKIVLISIVLAVAAAAAFLFIRKGNSAPKYRTEKIVRGTISETVTASGTLNAVTNVLVGTQVSGTIREIFVDFNSAVRKGQVIAQIDPATFEAQVEQGKANLLTAQANLEKAEAAYQDAQRTAGRLRELFGKNLISRSDRDTAETNEETARSQVSAAKAQVSQAEASLKISRTNLGYTRIVSPVDGIVISRNVDIGQTVAASFQTPTLFSIAQDLTKMQINTSVDEADIGRVKAGQDVEFTVDAYPEATFKGKVFQVRNAPVTVQNVVTYDVIIKVDNPELRLKPGMTANVSIMITTKDNVLKVPKAALRFSPQNQDKGKPNRPPQKGSGVWVLQNNLPMRVPVTLGIGDSSAAELLAGELKEGQEVIVESLDKPSSRQSAGPRMF